MTRADALFREMDLAWWLAEAEAARSGDGTNRAAARRRAPAAA